MDVDGDGIVWLTECGSMPADSVTDMIARGPQTGLPVLAVTTSAQVAGELADLTNVLVVHRMTDAAVARRLAVAAGYPDPVMSAAGGTGPGFADGGRPGSPGRPGAPRRPRSIRLRWAMASSCSRSRTRRGWYRAPSPSRPGSAAPLESAHDIAPGRTPLPRMAVRHALSRARTAAPPARPAGAGTAQPGLGGGPAA